MSWWDAVALEPGQERTARIGALLLRVARDAGRVRVAWRYAAMDEGIEAKVSEPVPADAVDDDWLVQRFAVDAAPVSLAPKLAPRPVVARPEVPFSVVPGGAVTVYVGTPLWVLVKAGDIELIELPAVEPKPTWFGTSLEGEHCIAMRTHLRMDPSEVVPRPHRAVAPVTIRNQGADALQVDRLWLPVQTLSLHLDGGRLATQAVELVRSEGQEQAERKIGAGRGTLLAAPRELPEANPVMRVFNSVFG